MSDARPLTPFERRLLERVVVHGEKPTAAVRALDPKIKYPDAKASKILARPHVQAARAKMEDDAIASAGVTRTWIINELRKIASATLYHEDGTPKDIRKLDPETASAVCAVEVDEVYAGRGKKRRAVGAVTKLKILNRKDALAELSAIAGLKRDQGAPPAAIGPGLTVIVQQAVKVDGSGQGPQQTRVHINLPKPTP